MNSFFPWKLFKNFFFRIWLGQLVTWALVFGLSFLWKGTFEGLFVAAFFLILLSSWYLSYRFSVPLKRVILKTLRMTRKKELKLAPDEGEDLFKTEYGEYSELEHALDQIQKKLKKRRIQLAIERQESQALMSALEDAVLTLTVDGKAVHFNSSFVSHFLPREQLKIFNDEGSLLFSQVFRDPASNELLQACISSTTTQRKDLRLKTFMHDEERFFAVTLSPIRHEKTREMTGILGLFHDVTEKKTIERMRNEFVENASHELRTPLTAVKGFVETIRIDFDEQKYEMIPHFLKTVSKNVDRLTEIVNDLLTLSNLEHSPQLTWGDFDPAAHTQEVIERLSSLATERRIVLRSFVGCPPFAADIAKIDQVLVNLIGNGIKYIPEGGQIEIRWIFLPESQKVQLQVIDNGPGIDREHLVRLFERFYRIDKGRSRDAGGSGLGLAIVKHIVQTHGGTVEAKSEVGRGTQLICEFPFRKGPP